MKRLKKIGKRILECIKIGIGGAVIFGLFYCLPMLTTKQQNGSVGLGAGVLLLLVILSWNKEMPESFDTNADGEKKLMYWVK